MLIKKAMSSLDDEYSSYGTPDPHYADEAISWNTCGSCQDADSATGCICPACNAGNYENCWCQSNFMNENDGDQGADSMTAQEVVTSSSLMNKAIQLSKINQALQDLKKCLSPHIETITKGWLGGTSQNSLDDSDFLWVSDAYKSGKTTDKSSGRKFPIAIHGKVDTSGWLAAWNVLHGSMGGGDFGGGPSKSQVMAKLMARKPAGITITDGHASRSSTQKAITEDLLPTFIEINKASTDLKHGIIFGKASVANITDIQGDIIYEEELEKAAYKFMAKANKRATNTHGQDIPGVWVSSHVQNGVWTVGFKPDDKQIAIDASNGLFVGWSIGGTATQIPMF